MKGGKEERRGLAACLLAMVSQGTGMEWYACNGCGKRARSASSFLLFLLVTCQYFL